MVEWDRHAISTLRANRAAGTDHVIHWPVSQGDVRDFPFELLPPEPELLSGGVPCQPFSLGGKHRSSTDARNMFPTFVEVVRTLRPKAFLVENVKGLLRASFDPYLQYIIRSLERPEILASGDGWTEHDVALQRGRPSRAELNYTVKVKLLNAADYGVPQRRERAFIVGLRRDLPLDWEFPRPTHSRAAMLFDKGVTGDYWTRHGLADSVERDITPAMALVPEHLPWVTVRDVISDLPSFGTDEADRLQHRLQVGARAYPGHAGSPLDLPAKTLKAGVHGVPGGENMVVLNDGSVRYMSIREAARIQTFPDDYQFEGSWSETMRQIGNAVPVELAEMLGASLVTALRPRRAEELDLAAASL